MALPSIESLQCFVTAARTLNFRAAARAVALSPAAFGERIRQLEEQLGARLFLRTTRTVSLTEAGLALVPRAEQVLAAAAACVSGEDAARPVMDIVLGTRHELGMSWVLPALGALREDQPWITFHLYFGSGTDLLLRVRTLEIDCAVTSSRFDDPRLDAIVLHAETYCMVGAPELLRRAPLRGPEDAEAHTMVDIALGAPLYRYFRDREGAPRLQFGGVLRMGTLAAIRAVVLEGRGVAVLPEYYVAKDLRRGLLLPLFPRVRLAPDAFRLVFRGDDPRRATYERVAARLASRPLR